MELRETKILIVDDTPEVISLVRRYLEDSDFRLSVASDGRMAIEKTFAESPIVSSNLCEIFEVGKIGANLPNWI